MQAARDRAEAFDAVSTDVFTTRAVLNSIASGPNNLNHDWRLSVLRQPCIFVRQVFRL